MVASSYPLNVEVFARTDEYTIAAWRRILMLIWKGKANAAGVERSRRVFDEWVTEYKRGAVFLVVVRARYADPPDERTREAMRLTAESPSVGLKGMGTLIQAEGFVAASIRSIIMRLNVLTGNGGAPNLFETASKAAEWAGDVLGDPEISGVKLTSAIRIAQEPQDEPVVEKVRDSA